jgi:tryptophan synthase beta chain
LHDLERIEYTSASDAEALAALHAVSRAEGIIPALETAHAFAELIKTAPQLSEEQIIIVNVSGRGDKDVNSVAEHLNFKQA